MTITTIKFACVGILTAGFVLTLCVEAQETRFPDPVYPFGAVYFRKSNPPEQDWERDHKTAAQMGVNIFRHWFMWASIENSPGKYDWRDYDRMVELEGQNHIKVVIAEIVNGAPEWMWDKYPHARHIDSSGGEGYSFRRRQQRDQQRAPVSGQRRCAGSGGKVSDRAGRALSRQSRHAWVTTCGTRVPCRNAFVRPRQAKFREWLKAKYGTIEALGRAWHRYSLGDWQSVHPPRGVAATRTPSTGWHSGGMMPFASCTGARNSFAGSIRGTRSPRTASAPLPRLSGGWRPTWTRSATRGLPPAIPTNPGCSFRQLMWCARGSRGKALLARGSDGRAAVDAAAGDQSTPGRWPQLGRKGRPRVEPDRYDRRRLPASSSRAGARCWTARCSVRSVPWGWTVRSPRERRWPASWHAGPTRTRTFGNREPVKGDVGIVFVQEADDFNSVQSGAAGAVAGVAAVQRLRRQTAAATGGGGSAAGAYVQSLQGAYQAFFDSNIQADFVSVDHIGEYPMIYLAYPEMLKKSTADKLRDYVAKGGKLISEGCPGYFGDGGTVGTVQPNLGLDQLFGARETYVQFTPDLLDKLTLTVRDKQIGGGYFLQEYKLAGGQAAGQYCQRTHRRRRAHLRQRQDPVDRHFPGRELLSEPLARNARILRRPARLGRESSSRCSRATRK